MKILLVACLLSSAMSILKNQRGISEWHSRSFGPVRNIHFYSSNLVYQSQSSSGIISKDGDILYSCSKQPFMPHQSADQDLLYFVNPEQLQIEVFSVDMQILISTIQLNLDDNDVQQIEYLQKQNQFRIVTSKTILQQNFQNYEFQEFYKAKNQEKIVGYFRGKVIFLKGNQMCSKTKDNENENCVQLKSEFKREQIYLEKDFVFSYFDRYVENGQQKQTQIRTESEKGLESKTIKSCMKYLGYDYYYDSSSKQIINHNKKHSLQLKSSRFDYHVTALTMTVTESQVINDRTLEVSLHRLDSNTGQFVTKNYQYSIEGAKDIEVSRLQFWKNKARLFIQTVDFMSYMFEIDGELRMIFEKDESINTIQDTLFVNFETSYSSKHVKYYESLDNDGLYNKQKLIQNFMLRINDEFQELTEYWHKIYNQISAFQQELSFDLQKIKQSLLKLNNLKGQTNYDILYAQRLIILLKADRNIVIALDSKKGTVLWRKQFRTIVNINQIEEQENRVVVSVQEQGKLILHILRPSSGELISKEYYNINIKKIFKLPKQTKIHQEALAMIDQSHKLHYYPSNYPLYQSKSDFSLQFYEIVDKQIQGYIVNNQSKSLDSQPIWKTNLGANEEIVRISENPSLQQTQLNSPLADHNRILYKYIDYNNIAMLTKIDSDLVLYIINSKSGKILYNNILKEVDLKKEINLVVDENAVFVSYFSSLNLGYEILAVEMYFQKTEHSALDMLYNYYFQTKKKQEDGMFIIQDRKYGFQEGIKKMITFSSYKSITRKNLLIITSNNQLYSLDRLLVSTRRQSSSKSSLSFYSDDLLPYQYLLPIMDQQFISLDYDLQNVSNLVLQPTNLESTSLVLVYGDSLFFTKVCPENRFDKLADDFNYVFLTGTVIAVVVATYMVKQLAQNSKANMYYN